MFQGGAKFKALSQKAKKPVLKVQKTLKMKKQVPLALYKNTFKATVKKLAALSNDIGNANCLIATKAFLAIKGIRVANNKEVYLGLLSFVNRKSGLEITDAKVMAMCLILEGISDTRIPIAKQLLSWVKGPKRIKYDDAFTRILRNAFTSTSYTSIIKKGLDAEWEGARVFGVNPRYYQFNKDAPVATMTKLNVHELAFFNELASMRGEHSVREVWKGIC